MELLIERRGFYREREKNGGQEGEKEDGSKDGCDGLDVD